MRASPVRLVPPGSIVGFLGDLAVPADFYWVAREPVPLAGMAYPGRVDWPALAAEGLGHVVCLTHDEPRYDPSPLTTTAVRLEDLFAGGAPSDPAAERAGSRRPPPRWSSGTRPAPAWSCTAWADGAGPAPCSGSPWSEWATTPRPSSTTCTGCTWAGAARTAGPRARGRRSPCEEPSRPNHCEW